MVGYDIRKVPNKVKFYQKNVELFKVTSFFNTHKYFRGGHCLRQLTSRKVTQFWRKYR